MEPDALAALITACTAFIVALGGLIGVIMPKLRQQDRQVQRVADDVSAVHTIVNQQRTDAQNYAAALVDALHSAGVKVPVDQSLTFGPLPPHPEPGPDGSTPLSGRFEMDPPDPRHRA